MTYKVIASARYNNTAQRARCSSSNFRAITAARCRRAPLSAPDRRSGRVSGAYRPQDRRRRPLTVPSCACDGDFMGAPLELCRSELAANDVLHRYNAPQPSLLLPRFLILRHCDVFVTNFTAVEYRALYFERIGERKTGGWTGGQEKPMTSRRRTDEQTDEHKDG
ncbi:hypothetical protein EVAR_82677_1 [Eumeta japonica]|uniref:Uncharacterized protein n=1 Tax=Eumeta variegata TaxID=151549 RepID=A0A4C1VBS5_EUMVA|nr:hypothetical protein EVAR_82677_1 [Eumeta japonica]